MNEKLQLQEKHDQHLKRKEIVQTRKKQDKEEAAKILLSLRQHSTYSLFCSCQALMLAQCITKAKYTYACITSLSMKKTQELDTASCGASSTEEEETLKLAAASVIILLPCQTLWKGFRSTQIYAVGRTETSMLPVYSCTVCRYCHLRRLRWISSNQVTHKWSVTRCMPQSNIRNKMSGFTLWVTGAKLFVCPGVINRTSSTKWFSQLLWLNQHQLITNRNKDTAGETVDWMKIHSLGFCKDEPLTFQYSYEPMGEYQTFVTNVASGRTAKPATLMPLYTWPLGISKAKRWTSFICVKGEPYLRSPALVHESVCWNGSCFRGRCGQLVHNDIDWQYLIENVIIVKYKFWSERSNVLLKNFEFRKS